MKEIILRNQTLNDGREESFEVSISIPSSFEEYREKGHSEAGLLSAVEETLRRQLAIILRDWAKGENEKIDSGGKVPDFAPTSLISELEAYRLTVRERKGKSPRVGKARLEGKKEGVSLVASIGSANQKALLKLIKLSPEDQAHILSLGSIEEMVQELTS